MIICCRFELVVGGIYSTGFGVADAKGGRNDNHPVRILRESKLEEYVQDLIQRGGDPSPVVSNPSGFFFYEIYTD